MKCASILSLAILLATISMGSAHVFAQTEPRFPPDTSAPPPVGGHRGMMDPAQQLEGMTKRYNLSADQQTQLKPILASQQQQMQALRGDSSLSREDRMAKMQSIGADTKTKIEAVLNDDQKNQFEADQQRMQGGGPTSQQ
jgi:Spy/CpxP family protein refolding chaperone